MSQTNRSINDFVTGLVFGFDVGTGSIGYAVREGDKFLDVGVIICDSEGSDLSKRRELRRQRRTLRSRKYRREWFAAELAKLDLPRPHNTPNDPISLRVRALNGEKLAPEELHTALTHLFKRRGYQPPPWTNIVDGAKGGKKKDEEGVIKKQVAQMREKLGDNHPCQYLAKERGTVGKSPLKHWARKIYWPREMLEKEFRDISAAQAENYPALAEKVDWLLYGETREVKGSHVFFKTTEARNPGLLGLRWPRFDNRGPALDSLEPVDGQGRPLHVVRKNKKSFTGAQWELALMNFRVLDAGTRQKIDPRGQFPEFIESLRSEWNKKGKVTIARLQSLAAPYVEKFLLIENQKALTPETGAGRARYSTPTLEIIRSEIAAGRRVDTPQPILRREGEDAEAALNRYLTDIKHPLVRHRLALFRRLLAQLVHNHGQPDIVVLEAVRSLALGQKAKSELNKRNEQFRKDREIARGDLAAAGKSISRKAITRYRLWREAQSTCPFCGDEISQDQLLNDEADIEHLVPRSIVDCSELYNLTIGHIRCNREVKGNKTPYAAFSPDSEKWEQLKANAEKCFKGRKLEIFLSPDAEQLIEQKSDLQHTAYIARVIRGVALIQLGWVGEDGRDPTIQKGNTPSASFQVTNGQLTSRLRGAWGLNQILHPLPPGQRWDDLTVEQKNQFTEKNRGDLRHHALDAMVISCTLPWLAHRTHGAKDEDGNHGWWTQDEKQRSKAANPVFPRNGQMYNVCKAEIETVVVQHHVSRSNHKRIYDTTIYGRPKKTAVVNGEQRRVPIANCYVAREPITSLNPNDIKSPKTGKTKIYPPELGYYLAAAWESFCEIEIDWEKLLKANKNCLPEAFQRKLCFSAFQKWRANGAPEFSWPAKIKIPIRSVGYVGVESDKAVAPASPGTNGFVARGAYKEVRIHIATDGSGLMPVLVPYWKKDRLICEQQFQTGKPIGIIRLGDLIELKQGYGPNNPPGTYRVVSTMQKQIQLLPPNIADTKEALRASGFLENGINLRWPAFFKAAGYELPHPPSAQLRSPDSAEP